MPRQHLASQAPPSASPFQQLSGLALLHARIRLGQPTLTQRAAGAARAWQQVAEPLPVPCGQQRCPPLATQ